MNSSVIDQKIIDAKELLERNEIDQVLNLANEILETDPNNLVGYAIRGLALEYKGDLKGALEAYDEYPGVSMENLEIQNWKALVLKNLDRFDEAKRLFNEILSVDPSYTHASYNLGIIYLETGENEIALEHFSKVLSIEPEYTKAYLLKGEALYQLARYKEAEKTIHEAINRNYIDPFAYNLLGNIRFLQDKYESAIQNYAEAIKLDPNYIWSIRNTGLAWESMGYKEKALEFYDQALGIDKNDEWSLEQIAHLYFNQQEYSPALEFFRKTLKVNSNKISLLLTKADYLNSIEYHDFALKYYSLGLEFDPGNKWIYRNMAVIMDINDRDEKAVEYLEQALKIDPKFIDALNDMGNVYSKIGEYSEARICYEKVIRLDDEYLYAYRNKAKTSLKLGKPKEAIAICNEAIHMNVDDPYNYEILGDVYKTLKDEENTQSYYKTAIDCMDRILSQKKREIEMLIAKNRVLTKLNKNKKAIEVNMQLLDLQPNNISALINLTLIYSERDEENYYNYAKKAYDTSPHNMAAIANYAECLFKMGKYDESRSIWDKLKPLNITRRNLVIIPILFKYLSFIIQKNNEKAEEYFEKLIELESKYTNGIVLQNEDWHFNILIDYLINLNIRKSLKFQVLSLIDLIIKDDVPKLQNIIRTISKV